jgi:hypothetical protein
LLSVLTLATVWAWQVGEAADAHHPIAVLAHGRKAVSLLRHGLDTILTALLTLLYTPAAPAPRRHFLALASKLSPT